MELMKKSIVGECNQMWQEAEKKLMTDMKDLSKENQDLRDELERLNGGSNHKWQKVSEHEYTA